MNSQYYPDPTRPEIGNFCLKGCWTLLLGGFLFGMVYLWIYSQVVQTSNAVDSHEDKLAYLMDRSVTLQSQLETLQSPRSIARMLEDREITLADPAPGQIVRVQREDLPAAEDSPRRSSPRELVILSIAR